MTTAELKTLKFDPGFARHTTILSINLEYIYNSLASYKNFNQKKMKFKLNYPNIIKMVANNVGFCLGCMLWAVYIKSFKNVQIEGNPCLGDEFNPDESVEEIDYSINYFEKLKKDAKYYLNQNYEYDSQYIDILNLYREFLLLNENFVNTKTTDDIKLPPSLKTPSAAELEEIHNKIEEVIKTGKLTDLMEVWTYVL